MPVNGRSGREPLILYCILHYNHKCRASVWPVYTAPIMGSHCRCLPQKIAMTETEYTQFQKRDAAFCKGESLPIRPCGFYTNKRVVGRLHRALVREFYLPACYSPGLSGCERDPRLCSSPVYVYWCY